jgi:hypothetical protein
MPLWHGPHGGVPHPEAAGCWVCRRSSRVCGTCRNARRAVAGSFLYCALDRNRSPLRGDEVRACWEAAPIPVVDATQGSGDAGGRDPGGAAADRQRRQARPAPAFVPLDAVPVRPPPATPVPERADGPAIPAGERIGTLWHDLEGT